MTCTLNYQISFRICVTFLNGKKKMRVMNNMSPVQWGIKFTCFEPHMLKKKNVVCVTLGNYRRSGSSCYVTMEACGPGNSGHRLPLFPPHVFAESLHQTYPPCIKTLTNVTPTTDAPIPARPIQNVKCISSTQRLLLDVT